MYELRILSGLKGGVSFSLDKEPLYIGSGDDNDILMLDRSFLGATFSAKETDDRKIEIFFSEGEFKDINGDQLSDMCILEPRDIFFHKDVWLQIASTDTPWLDQLPVVTPRPAEPPPKRSTKVPTILAGGVFSAVIFGLYNLSYANQSEPPVLNQMPSGRTAIEQNQAPMTQSNKIAQFTQSNLGAMAGGQVEHNYSEKLEIMLRERELDDIKVEEKNGQIVLVGSLSKRDKDVLNRMLMRYEFEYPTSPTIENDTNEHGDDFPIKVLAVVSGPYGHVLLEDGTRLYKGQTYMGYRLVAIKKDTIEFQGGKKVAVRW